MRNIDYDRGVTKRFNEALAIDVYMYKDTPGVYYNAFGDELPEDVAKKAGFDVKAYGQAKMKREKMDEAMGLIEAELAMADLGAPKHEVVLEKGGYQVVDTGLGRYYVQKDNARLNTAPLPREQAELLLDKLQPAEKGPVARAKAQKETV